MLTFRAYKRIKKQVLQKAPLTHLWISAQNLTTLRVLSSASRNLTPNEEETSITLLIGSL